MPISHFLLSFMMNGSIYFIYKYKIPFFEQYKIDSNPWPWEENYGEWKAFLIKTLKLVVFNGVVIIPLVHLFLWNIYGQIPYDTSVEGIPTSVFGEILPQMYFCMLLEDTYYYWGHRLLHHKKLYPLFHKVHH
jgi:sterol desaturase/sphingolipid hydroxylase (fatty acid hydroxylase superfamily)